jgi:hypothetical protein
MTELKILVLGFIFLVTPFSIFLDSFQNIVQQKNLFFIYQIFQTKWHCQCVGFEGVKWDILIYRLKIQLIFTAF